MDLDRTSPATRRSGSLYLGGPSRDNTQHFEIRSGEEAEAARDARTVRRRRRRRVHHGTLVALVATVLGVWAVLGLGFGQPANPTEAGDTEETPQDWMEKQRMQVLQELWKMEALDRPR
mgnify:CR=1 FL=1